MSRLRTRRLCLLAPMAAALALAGAPLHAAPGDQPVKPGLPQVPQPEDKTRSRTASLPAKGLFVGDKLSDSAKARLTDLVLEALGLNVEVALVVPVGPWQIDGGTHADNALTDARLGAVRRFLAERGVDPRRIYVESRTDAKVKEPRLDVQLVGKPGGD